jgi:hypothetical protein
MRREVEDPAPFCGWKATLWVYVILGVAAAFMAGYELASKEHQCQISPK